MTRASIGDIDVWRVVAEGGPGGGPAAFAKLEAALPTLRGRRFYATYKGGEYSACVAVKPEDDGAAMGLHAWRIPGGEYERRKLSDWQDRLDEIGAMFDVMAQGHDVDPSRPSIEFYRSSRELVLLLPVR